MRESNGSRAKGILLSCRGRFYAVLGVTNPALEIAALQESTLIEERLVNLKSWTKPKFGTLMLSRP